MVVMPPRSCRHRLYRIADLAPPVHVPVGFCTLDVENCTVGEYSLG